MKSLYESILASTQSGKVAFVKKWIFDNLFNHEIHTFNPSVVDEYYDITPDGISTKQQSNLGVDIDQNVKGEIPKEIKFNQIYDGFTFGRKKNITVKQLPKYVHKLYINGEIGTIPSFKMELSSALEIEGSSTILEHIEPIELKFVEYKKTGRSYTHILFYVSDLKKSTTPADIEEATRRFYNTEKEIYHYQMSLFDTLDKIRNPGGNENGNE